MRPTTVQKHPLFIQGHAMQLTFEITSAHHHDREQRAHHIFTDSGGRIGRDATCDWTLIDVEKRVSNEHARVSFQDGGFYLTDVSSNGIQRPDSGEVLSKHVPLRIEHGDRFVLGSFVLRASLGLVRKSADQEAAGVLPANSVVTGSAEGRQAPLFASRAGDSLGKRLNESTHWHPTDALVTPVRAASVPALNVPVPALVPQQRTAAPQPAPLTPTFWAQFATALGINLDDLDNAQRETLAINAAALLHDSVAHVQQCLRTRDELVADLRVPNTCSPHASANPIIHCTNAPQALSLLLHEQPTRQLPARQALHQAYRDVQAHQVAMLAASRAAVAHVLNQLAPPQLALRFEQRGRPLWGVDASHWRAYQRLYETMKRDDDWGERLFANEFASVYERQVRLVSALHADYRGFV